MIGAASRYLVTGASSGLGKALSTLIARRGGSVWGIARRPGPLEETARELGPDRFRWSACDTGDPESVRASCRTMRGAGFVPDVVILNAGINTYDAEGNFDAARFDAMIRANLLGVSTWIAEWLPEFLARKHGAFAAVSSMAAIQGNPRSMGYCVSKRALSELFRYLRVRYGHSVVPFTTIHLGAIDTPMSRSTRLMPGAYTADRAARIVLEATERRRRSVYRPSWALAVSLAARAAPDALVAWAAGKAAARKPPENPAPPPDTR